MHPMTSTKNPADLELPDDVEALKAIVAQVVAEKDAALASRDATIAALHEQIQLLLARRFAASSERVANGQLGLFNEAEELDADTAPKAEEDDEASVAVAGFGSEVDSEAPRAESTQQEILPKLHLLLVYFYCRYHPVQVAYYQFLFAL